MSSLISSLRAGTGYLREEPSELTCRGNYGMGCYYPRRQYRTWCFLPLIDGSPRGTGSMVKVTEKRRSFKRNFYEADVVKGAAVFTKAAALAKSMVLPPSTQTAQPGCSDAMKCVSIRSIGYWPFVRSTSPLSPMIIRCTVTCVEWRSTPINSLYIGPPSVRVAVSTEMDRAPPRQRYGASSIRVSVPNSAAPLDRPVKAGQSP